MGQGDSLNQVYSQIGRDFTIKSLLAIVGLALAVQFLPYPAPILFLSFSTLGSMIL